MRVEKCWVGEKGVYMLHSFPAMGAGAWAVRMLLPHTLPMDELAQAGGVPGMVTEA